MENQNYELELYHYGVKGMKWGVRKKYYNTDGTPNALGRSRQAMRDAKSAYKTANKAYSKSYNKASNYSGTHPISQWVGKKAKAKSNALWGDAYDKAEQANKAQDKYKQAKKDYKKVKSDVAKANAKVKKDAAEANAKARAEFRNERRNVSKSRSMGAKLVTNLWAGPFANRTYNSVRAAGGSKAAAFGATTAAAMLGGPTGIGHLAVSALITSHMGEKNANKNG